MKILVIEDDILNQEAARKQLGNLGHEVVIMDSFTKFFNAVNDWCCEPKMDIAVFDAVLTDVNLPSPHDNKGEVHAATGFAIVLKALAAGVKYIGIITDADHHDDAYGKALDLWLHKPPFKVGNQVVWPECYNAGSWSEEHQRKIKNWARLLEGMLKL